MWDVGVWGITALHPHETAISRNTIRMNKPILPRGEARTCRCSPTPHIPTPHEKESPLANTLSADALAAIASVYALGGGFAITEDRDLCVVKKSRGEVTREVLDDCTRHYA